MKKLIYITYFNDELSSQESQSAETVSQGRDDILASVLGQEHPGRVRAGGKFSTITSFFKNNRRSRKTSVAHIKDVEAIVQERFSQQQQLLSQQQQE
ncbi:hypothetical protein KSP40_PGU013237 [Platanthera guangdongensis]|uniref:Uncharacterized protein n=1 Tax=Platanthera guangdongensis TaxID=2320717 RepID=A0ABR2LMV0_9ASPA